jgi:hypothetical protein
MPLSKKDYEIRLQANQFVRKWVVIPSCWIAGGMFMFDAYRGMSWAWFWLFMLTFNLINLWHNGNLKKVYETAISYLDGQERRQKVAELNPHKK